MAKRRPLAITRKYGKRGSSSCVYLFRSTLKQPYWTAYATRSGLWSTKQFQAALPAERNLHLTLIFIGEAGPAEQAKAIQVMDQVNVTPFCLALKGFGRFRRSGGDICWLGIEPNPMLQSLHAQLHEGLRAAGFSLEMQEYKPHLTLGRQVVLPGDFDPSAFAGNLKPLSVPVSQFSLMQSVRIQGVLHYVPVYTQVLI